MFWGDWVIRFINKDYSHSALGDGYWRYVPSVLKIHASNLYVLSSLWPVESTWRHRSDSTLVHVDQGVPRHMAPIHRWPVNSPHKGPVTRKMFPFNGVIMDVTDRRFCTKPLPHLQQFSAKIQHTSLEKLIHSQTSQYILKPSLPLVRTKLRWVHAYNICVGGITSSSSLSRARLL